MNKTVISGLAAIAALGLSTAGVQAQSVNLEKPITIKLGVFFPSDGSVKSNVGNTFFAAGAELGLSKSDLLQTTVPLLYVDYNGDSNNGYHLYDTGVGVGVKQYLGNSDAKNVPYVGAGVGAYFDEVNAAGNSENKTNFGGKLDVGYEFDHAALVEVDYQDAGSVAGVRANGFDVLVGYRF